MTAATAAFAAVFAAFYTAHMVGDHWVQTNHQAANKGLPGWPGRRACAAHVLTLNGTKCAAVLTVMLVTGLRLAAWALALALVIDAASHYWADRRSTLAGLAALIPGKADFYRMGAPREGHDDNPSLGSGAYVLDQSWHIGWLFIAALIASAGAS
jgi:Protein of unknown function (DUF3307)